MAAPGVRRRDRGVRRPRGHDAVADVPAVAELRRHRLRVRPIRCSDATRRSTSSRCRGSSSSRAGSSRRSSACCCSPRSRTPLGGIRPTAPAFGEKVTAAGEGAPVGPARPRRADEGLGVLPRPVRSAELAPRRRRGRLVHRRERAAAGAPDPRDRRDRLRRPVPREHPATRVGPAGDRGRAPRVRLDRGRRGLSRVRPAVPRHAAGAPARAAVHRGQHRGDEAARSGSTGSNRDRYRCPAP